jgi:SnoaL-like domain
MTGMSDHRLLINLVNRIFTAADLRDWTTYRSMMMDTVDVDFSGVGPHRPGPAAADHLARNTRHALGAVRLTQHMLTNHVVKVDGDQARVSFYEQALHHHPALGEHPDRNTWTLFARATRDATRTENGWRIHGAGLQIRHQTGNPGLLAEVAALPAAAIEPPTSTDDTKDSATMIHPTDAEDVLNVVHTYFTTADEHDWNTYRRLHAERVTVDFGGINDDSRGDIPADEMLRSARALLDPVDLTQHMISSEVVTVDGDHAAVAFYEQALHHHPTLGDDPTINTWILYGRGRHQLRRTGDGWKIVSAALTPVHATGNPNLLSDVAGSLR